MDWFRKQDTQNSNVQVAIQTKTLTVKGVETKAILKHVETEQEQEMGYEDVGDLQGYTIAEQGKIYDYFNLLVETQNYCKEVLEIAKERYLVFAKHPFYSKFTRKIMQKFDKDWKYNLLIIAKDKSFVGKMRALLKDIVENPSTSFDFEDASLEIITDWKKGMKKTLELVKSQGKPYKLQLKSFYLKLKNS